MSKLSPGWNSGKQNVTFQEKLFLEKLLNFAFWRGEEGQLTNHTKSIVYILFSSTFSAYIIL